MLKYFILYGPTASGKSALLDYLLMDNSDYLEPLISFTSRMPKPEEKDGKNYYFISRDQYLDLLSKNKIIEEIKYLDHYYGITYDELSRVSASKKNGLAIMDLNGIRQLKHSIAYQKVISIFIYRDLSEIIKSIQQSKRSNEEKLQRIDLAKQELRNISLCDHVVHNVGTLADANQQLVSIIKKEINSIPIEMDIKKGQRYQHCKGDKYEIVSDIAYHTETDVPLVICRNERSGKVEARPYEIFCGKKEWPPVQGALVNRFELIKD